jgi:hypothetical protein
MRLRLRRGTAPQWKAQHLEFRNDALQRQTNTVPDAHAMRRFHSLGVQMNFAAGDGRRGKASRFVKAAMPEPFVQSVTVAFIA